MFGSRATIIAAGLLASLPSLGADVITIDGRLDEAEWATAKAFTDFRITEPLTGEVPPYRTELRLLARPDGLFFGVRSEIPRDQRTHGRSQRDAESLDADPVILFVDFEGRGRTAYEFTISMSGTQRDSVVLNQTTNSRDWDAVWFAAVTEDDTGWTAEFRIPWSVAPEGVVDGDKRTIGFYASRYIKKTSTRYALPAIELFKPTFVQELQRVEVPRFKTSSLDVVPYVAATTDLLDSSTTLRGGLDVTWKPNGANQLTATLKPDFGQVESDDLVVNFSAIETFFSDKRPFFTEGIQLFDLRMPVNGRLVNTRRVGGAPDVGPEGATDVLAGTKYTGGNGASEYGVFAALEEDSSEADGRQFVAARFHRKFDSMSVGYLGTFVDHPTIDRDAQVHAVDFDATFGKGFILNAQAIATDIGDPALATESPANDGKGFGAWTTLQYQPGGAWQEALRLIWYDRDFNVNDFGYIERGNLHQLNSETYYYTRSYPDTSVLATTNWYLNWNLRYNDRGDRLPANAELGYYWQFKNGDYIYTSYFGESSGLDDLLTRGNGNVRLDARSTFYSEFQKASTGRFRFMGKATIYQEGISGWSREIIANPKYFVTETLSLGLNVTFVDSDDWLIWTGGTQLGSFKARQWTVALDGAWYPALKHELRLKAQWIGLHSHARHAYDVVNDQEPIPSDDLLEDFSVTRVEFQLRYRYEIGPLSDFYLVYNRGGDLFEQSAESSFGHELGDVWSDPSSDQFLVKLRYRF